MYDLHHRLSKFSIYKFILDTAKKIVFPGFNKLPLFNVIKFFIEKIQSSDLSMRASALSFNFFLALFPGIIFLFTLIPYISIEGVDFQKELLTLLRQFFPKDAYTTINETLTDIISQPRGGLLSFGFISALILSTNGINTIIDSFNKSYQTKETRSFMHQRLVALGLNFILILLLLVAIILIIIGQLIIDHFENLIPFDILTFYALNLTRWVIIVSLILFSISILFYYGPAVKKKWRFISAGSTLSTILSILSSVSFAYYINNFGQYNKLYGSIGTLIVIMFWIYINCLILLIGFDLNASIFKKDEL